MPKTFPLQTNFTAGEFSPRLYGRVDIQKYPNAVKTMENAIPLPHGGVKRRPGSQYVAEGKGVDTGIIRIYQFEFSVTQAYIIEFGHQYFRVYKDNGQIASGGSAVEVVTTYDEDDLFDLHFAQSADVLYIVHKGYVPRKITRSSHTSWSIADVSFSNKPSGFVSGANTYPGSVTFFQERLFFAGSNNSPQTLYGSKAGSYEDMDQGSGASDDGVQYTLAANEVNVIQWLASSSTGMLIGTVGGEFIATGGGTGEPITPTNIMIVPETRFGSSSVSPVEVGRSVLFVQRSKRKIQELTFNLDVEGYVAPDLTILSEHITTGGINDMAYQKEPDRLLWMVRNDGQLLSMTYERDQNVVAWARHIMGGHFGDATITVTDYANIAVGTTVTITKTDGSTVVFTSEAISGSAPSETNGWRPNESNDTTADNLFTAINAHADFTVANPAANVVTITETVRSGDGLISIVTSDTTRLATTNEGAAVVESVASIPSADGSEDELWLVVKRTINGSTKRYIEYLDSTQNVDSGLDYSGGATATLTGLGHLEAETVQIVSSNAVKNDQRVASGSAAVSGDTVTTATAGLRYTTKIVTLSPEMNLSDGASFGKKKTFNRIILNLFETIGVTVNDKQITFRTAADEMNESVDLFTGLKEVTQLGWDLADLNITIKQTQPLPFTLISLTGELSIND